MVELVRTNDLVVIGFLESLLEADGIPVLVADSHMGALEGSIGAFQRRLLVPEDWAPRARRLVVEAGLGTELRDV
jgi:predicted acylesterase/phospholipase RssA